MEHLLLLPLYICGCMKYIYGYWLYSGKWLRVRWYLLGLALAVVAAFLTPDRPLDSVGIRMALRVMVAATTFFLIPGKLVRKLTCTFILTISLDGLSEFFHALFYGTDRVHLTTYQNLISDLFALGALLIYAATRRFFQEKVSPEAIKNLVPLLTLLGGIVLIFAIEGLSYASIRIGETIFARFVYLISIAGVLGVLLAAWNAVFLYRANEKLLRYAMDEADFAKIQGEYFESMLEREKQTRQFRHDITNHLVCLKDMLSAGQSDEAFSYLEMLSDEVEVEKKRTIRTGVRVFDALTTHYMERLSDAVSVEVKGEVRHDLSIPDSELCTIYGNLLSNAVEAVERTAGERWIKIQFREGEKHLEIRIENSSDGLTRFDADGKPVTRKSDTKNHGLGLTNVRDAVRRQGGRLSLSQTEKSFLAEVVLPTARGVL